MKRFGLVFIFSLVVSFIPFSGVQAINVDDFQTRNYNVELKLSRDENRRSKIEVTETIKVVFPNFDQNHGIIREVPPNYDGHTTRLKIHSITDKSGHPWEYSVSPVGSIKIGNADTYLYGEQTFVIKYSQQDVTKYYKDVDKDEFYWDVLGVGWRTPIEAATITIDLSDDIVAELQGDPYCYIGTAGSTERCQLVRDDENPGRFTVSAQNLSSFSGITASFGFGVGTFAEYQPTLWERFWTFWKVAQLILIAPMLLLVVIVKRQHRRLIYRESEEGTIIPEYLPPQNVSLSSASSVLGEFPGSRVMVAQIIDLAVRHYIKLIEAQPAKPFRPAEYQIEVVKNLQELLPDERGVIEDMVDGTADIGRIISLKTLKNDTAYHTRVQKRRIEASIAKKKDNALFEDDDSIKQRYKRLRRILTGAGVIGGMSLTTFVTVMVVAIITGNHRRLSDKGLSLRRYLMGLKTYIKVAEVDRLNMLQSPDGVTKVAYAPTVDDAQLTKLYERVLPYAVLFGQQKQWTEQIGRYYETTSTEPDWYVGQSAFTAGALNNALVGFGTSLLGASGYISSSGGSSGGGSSGGGGGGGGGGGW